MAVARGLLADDLAGGDGVGIVVALAAMRFAHHEREPAAQDEFSKHTRLKRERSPIEFVGSVLVVIRVGCRAVVCFIVTGSSIGLEAGHVTKHVGHVDAAKALDEVSICTGSLQVRRRQSIGIGQGMVQPIVVESSGPHSAQELGATGPPELVPGLGHRARGRPQRGSVLFSAGTDHVFDRRRRVARARARSGSGECHRKTGRQEGPRNHSPFLSSCLPVDLWVKGFGSRPTHSAAAMKRS